MYISILIGWYHYEEVIFVQDHSDRWRMCWKDVHYQAICASLISQRLQSYSIFRLHFSLYIYMIFIIRRKRRSDVRRTSKSEDETKGNNIRPLEMRKQRKHKYNGNTHTISKYSHNHNSFIKEQWKKDQLFSRFSIIFKVHGFI